LVHRIDHHGHRILTH